MEWQRISGGLAAAEITPLRLESYLLEQGYSRVLSAGEDHIWHHEHPYAEPRVVHYRVCDGHIHPDDLPALHDQFGINGMPLARVIAREELAGRSSRLELDLEQLARKPGITISRITLDTGGSLITVRDAAHKQGLPREFGMRDDTISFRVRPSGTILLSELARLERLAQALDARSNGNSNER